MAPSKKKRTHTVFRDSSAHRSASTSKPRFVGEKVKLGELLLNTFSGEWGTEEGELLTPVLRTSNFNEDGSLNYSTPAMRCIPEGKVAKKRMVRGDIILEKSGGTPKRPVGIMAFYDSDALALCSNFNQVLRFDESRILPRFAFHQLRWLKDRNAFDRYTRKTTGLQNLQMKKLIELKLRVPQIEDQTSIATTLDEIVCDQRTLQQEIACLDSLVKSRFVEMFGDPVTAVSDITLGEVANMKAGKTTTAKTIHDVYAPGLYPCYGGNGFRGYSAEPTHEGVFPLIGRQGALCGNVQIAHGTFRATEHAVVVDCKTSCEPVWLFHYLKYDNLGRLATGAAQPGLSLKDLKLVPVQLPPKDRQVEFISFVSQVDKSRFVRDHEINFRWERFTLSWSTIA